MLGALGAAVPVSAQFSVYPATVELEAAAGVGTRSLTVENQGDVPLEVGVYLGDYDRAEDGAHTYAVFGEHEHSCRDRLEAYPDQLVVEPGGREEIRLRVELGGPTCWGMVFVERRTGTASGITVAQRIAVKVLSQAAGGAREGRVVGVAVDTAESRRVVAIRFENEGERALDVTGEVEVRDLDGEVVAVVPVEGFQVLPARRRRVLVPVEGLGLEPGGYVLVAILDFGADYLAGGQAMLEVRP